MPALASLYIGMTEEDQVDLIMRRLPQLRFLNGLPVERDEPINTLQDVQLAYGQ
jgi:hypothetical protein